jgi:signal transduction histidine kinase
MSNLLTNAVNSTKKRSIGGSDSNSNGSIQGDCSTITVSTTIKKSIDNYKKNNDNKSINGSHGEEVIISITDRGTGIDSDIQDKLFSKFVTKSDAGSGLGLYISKRIIEAHRGRIYAENNSDGNGATFRFSLPVLGAR